MKAISLWQPWATLLVMGIKKIETRSWPIRHRGPLLIHAAKRKIKSEIENYSEDETFDAAFHAIGGTIGKTTLYDLPYGAILGAVDVIDCFSTNSIKSNPELKSRLLKENYTPNYGEDSCREECYSEWDLGNYANDRYGWVCDNFRPLGEPIPYKGEQGLFEVPSIKSIDWIPVESL